MTETGRKLSRRNGRTFLADVTVDVDVTLAGLDEQLSPLAGRRTLQVLVFFWEEQAKTTLSVLRCAVCSSRHRQTPPPPYIVLEKHGKVK